MVKRQKAKRQKSLNLHIWSLHYRWIIVKMEWTFANIMEVVVTPITVFIGLLGNGLSICVLNKKEIQLRRSFTRILIALSVFDITFISASVALFSFR